MTSILVIRRKLKWKYTYRTRCTERQHRYPEVSATRSTRGRETWCTRKPREDAPDARSSHVCASEVWPDAEAVPLGRFVAGWSDFGRTGSEFASGGSRPSENARWSSMSFDVDRSRRRLRRGDYFFYYFSRIYLKLGHRYCILLCDTALDNRLSTNSVFRRQVEGAARNLSISIIANFFFRPQASFEFRISHLDFVTFDALNITGDVAKPCLKYYVRVYFSFLFFFFFFLINAEPKNRESVVQEREIYLMSNCLVPSDAVVRVQLTIRRRRGIVVTSNAILNRFSATQRDRDAQFTMPSVSGAILPSAILKLPLLFTFFSIKLKSG